MPAEFFADLTNQQTPPKYRFFDGSSWRESESGKTVPVKSPINGEVLGELQVVTTAEIDAAFAAAHASQGSWEATPLNQRVKIMHLAADWIRHFQDYLINLLIREIGKTQDEAKSEIVRTADLVDYFADEAQSIRGETLDSDNFPGYDKGRIALVEHVAWGVVVAIAPFNYPVNLAASKIAPALLMGNSVVFKPPTQGGISGLHLTQIFQKAGLPSGVLTCLTGTGSDIGDYLVSHPQADMLAFTGSSETGVAIAAKAPMKPLLFECGGNNPAVVLPDADLSATARELVKGAFSYCGQRCTGIKYVLATQAVLAKLIPLVLQAMAEIVKPGDPRSPETKLVGPVVSEEAAANIEKVVSEAEKNGAKIVTGGKRNKAYFDPTVLSEVKPTMTVVARETFGPVLSFITVSDYESAVKFINSSAYGLQTSVFTRDEGTGITFAKQLNVGTVQINGSPQRGPDHFPFLGIKKSGIGVQGVRYSLEAMSRLRPIVLNKPQ
ncbi:MAG: aldehyde dehydrogenase family protein [Patescibacteria group bacterium]